MRGGPSGDGISRPMEVVVSLLRRKKGRAISCGSGCRRVLSTMRGEPLRCRRLHSYGEEQNVGISVGWASGWRWPGQCVRESGSDVGPCCLHSKALLMSNEGAVRAQDTVVNSLALVASRPAANGQTGGRPLWRMKIFHTPQQARVERTAMLPERKCEQSCNGRRPLFSSGALDPL